MIKLNSIPFLFILITLAGILSLGSAFAWGGPGMMGGNGFGWGSGGGWEMREKMWDARIEVLAELSGKTTDQIQTELSQEPVWSLLQRYKIDREVFQNKMTAKAELILSQARDNGEVTSSDADWMLQRMNWRHSGERGEGRWGGGFGRNCWR